jgi:thiamine-monophosphate kinase
VSAVVEFGRIPVSAALGRHRDSAAVREGVLAGGDDYELAFTAPRARRVEVMRLARRLGIRLTRIGSIVRQRRGAALVTVIEPGGRPMALAKTGYRHF